MSIQTVQVDPDTLTPYDLGAYDLLTNLTDDDFNAIKTRLSLSDPGILGPQTLAIFSAFAKAHGLDLTPDGVSAFKTAHGLGDDGDEEGVIGPDTAEAYFASLTTAAPSGGVAPINDAGVALIKHFEGLDLNAYQDSVGVWTIGYGHTGPDVHPGLVITLQQALDLLQSDLLGARKDVTRLVTVDLNPNQYAALVSLAFNVGAGCLIGTHLAADLKSGNFDAAADDFLRFDHAGGQVLQGLLNRRRAERELFLS